MCSSVVAIFLYFLFNSNTQRIQYLEKSNTISNTESIQKVIFLLRPSSDIKILLMLYDTPSFDFVFLIMLSSVVGRVFSTLKAHAGGPGFKPP